MKKHANIPIFIPHSGCPHDCVFCNQKKITARKNAPTKDSVIKTIEEYLGTLTIADVPHIEIGFFGGSFTGIPLDEQNYYLSIAKAYKDSGKIQGIRLSTRPDYIDEEILVNLKKYSVDLIELGVQSFDDDILKLSERGHDSDQVRKAAQLIKDHGFELGIQLMIGLPGDTPEKSLGSAEELVALKPSVARLYPTVVLKDTKLMDMYERGEYSPFSEDEMLETVTDMFVKIESAGIKVIRIGLKSTDLIYSGSDDLVGDYHPAFSELVQGNVFFKTMVDMIENKLNVNSLDPGHYIAFTIGCNPDDISKLVGHKKINKERLNKKYPHIKFRFTGSTDIEPGGIEVIPD